MPYSVVDKPSKYFTAKLHTGTGSAQSITGLEFAPKFTWIKDRTSANNPRLYDIIRGATVELYPSLTEGDTTQAQSLTSFNSDGFSVGTLAQVNTNGNNYVSWNWRGSDSSAVSNTAGTITSTVSANTTSGFSIVSYTGTSNDNETVGHGLGVAPSMIIIKNRSVSANWSVLHTSAGLTGSTLDGSSEYYMLLLNDTGARANVSEDNIWQPTSTTFKINNTGAGTQVNGSGNSMIAYCFADVKGYSKFGSYTGNGSTDGTFSYTGFRPAFLMLKRTDTTGSWQMYDNKRDTYNPEISRLGANLSSEESTSASIYIDFLSNGFKMRNSTADWNASGGTYIYMCFAEQPFTSSKGIVANAR